MILGALRLALEAAAVLYGSHRLLRRLYGLKAAEPAVYVGGLGLLAAAQVVAIGLTLGYADALTPRNIALLHGAALLLTLAVTRNTVPREGKLWRAFGSSLARGWREASGLQRALALLLVAILAGALGLGIFGETLVHDSLSYRLSRIGYWLQEGSIRHFETNETRQSYSAIDGDLLMLWLVQAFPAGFPLVAVASFAGGVLLLASTWGLGRHLGLARGSALGALFLLVGMPSLFVQLMTSQTDLLTAGFLNAGIFFLLLSFEGGSFVLPAWLGVGLAVGTKGTVFYWGPGLALMGLVAARLYRPSARLLARHAALGALCLAALAAPRYAENLLRFRNPFAPPEAIALVQGRADPAAMPGKAALNAYSYLIELLEPASNPKYLSPLLRPMWQGLISLLPDSDPYAVKVYPRKAYIGSFSEQRLKNADALSFGALACLLAVAGATVALRRRARGPDRPSALVLALVAGAALFFASFSAIFLWWPVNFRQFALVAPAVVLAAAFAVDGLAPRARRITVAAIALNAGLIAGEVGLDTFNAGWWALRPPANLVPYYAQYAAERRIVGELLPAGATVGVALPYNSVLAGFFRSGKPLRILFLNEARLGGGATAGELLRAARLDALVTLPDSLGGRGGNATERLVIPNGDWSLALAVYTPGPGPAARLRAARR